ncbi:NDP-hexose 2,3-dehydratase family protein [Nonomuraea terrae]|uniref:NDP-hexose 2,3-dehydratase family protein n=1 Tax=Nonomuraea terrae TaxID=2530383 RepID=UPI001FE96EFA|nr:NDP-hexose 2,3-dehydratase family protein [Nonomuraea terrae]
MTAPARLEVPSVDAWLAERRRENTLRVRRVPLDTLREWRTDPETGDLRHRSGRFFTVEGIRIRDSSLEFDAWDQPLVVQPEYGVLGLLLKEVDGRLHGLFQAKVEPGNAGGTQLAPTVQATRSNYTRVHGGLPVPYLDRFLGTTRRRRGRILFDSLQSEQASWFLAKRNRNMAVLLAPGDDVPVLPGHHWVPLDDLGPLLRRDDLVGMDARSVLSGLVAARLPSGPERPHHDDRELLSWFTEAKAGDATVRRRIPLREVRDWVRTPESIHHCEHRHFAVIGVDVEATGREVERWSQPMLAPTGTGVVALLSRRVDGTRHYLVQARSEAGCLDAVEMAPTVQCQPGSYAGLPANRRPAFLGEVLSAPPERILLDTVQSEEGGRFYHARNRYLIVDVGEDFPLDVPDRFAWVTARQLTTLVCYANHLNVQVRTLLTLLGFAAADETAREAEQ